VPVALLSENGAGQGEPGHLLANVLDFGLLVGDGLLQLGDGFPESLLGFRDLSGFVANTFVELVLQVDVPFEEGHAMDVGLGGEGDDCEASLEAVACPVRSRSMASRMRARSSRCNWFMSGPRQGEREPRPGRHGPAPSRRDPARRTCDIKTLASEAAVDRTAFYGTRPYAHLRVEFERRLQAMRETGEIPDPREAQISRLKAENTKLRERLAQSEQTIDELTDFRIQALARLAAQHEEIVHLRGTAAAANHVTCLPAARTTTIGTCS